VVSPAGEKLGQVVDFEDGGMQAWLVVETAKGRSLVPFTEPLMRVDEESERIVLDAPEGLLDPETVSGGKSGD
jgi:ribosomal 30S subunit maturation factor RimM